MVGIAGSGKTTHVRDRFPGHAHVSMDIYKEDVLWPAKRHILIDRFDKERPLKLVRLSSRTKEAECVLVDDALKAGSSVVVDDTNLMREIRRPYVMLARKHGAAVRAVFFSDVMVARYRNSKRTGKDRVPEPAITGQQARMEKPSDSEGFDSIMVIS